MESSENKKLTRGSTFIAGGVCAGLANYTIYTFFAAQQRVRCP